MAQTIKKVFKTTSLIILAIFLLTACNNDRCEEEYVIFPFSETYKNWFKDIGITGTSVYKKAKSSSGLEETIGIGKSTDSEILKGPQKPCYYPSGKVLGIGYNSSLYNNFIGISLLQKLEGEAPVMRLKVEERSSEIVDRMNMEFQLESFRPEPIVLTRYRFSQATTEEIQTDLFPEVSVIDSLVFDGKLYRQIYKITNPYQKVNGNSFSLTEFYIHQDFGLMQYVQKDGVTWKITDK